MLFSTLMEFYARVPISVLDRSARSSISPLRPTHPPFLPTFTLSLCGCVRAAMISWQLYPSSLQSPFGVPWDWVPPWALQDFCSKTLRPQGSWWGRRVVRKLSLSWSVIDRCSWRWRVPTRTYSWRPYHMGSSRSLGDPFQWITQS